MSRAMQQLVTHLSHVEARTIIIIIIIIYLHYRFMCPYNYYRVI